MKNIFSLLVSFCSVLHVAHGDPLPVKQWKGPASAPYVFYVSGDGGFNKFSLALCGNLNAAGNAVGALDSRSYFWTAKQPGAAAADISAFLSHSVAADQKILLVGYSFGADVLPFIVNRLPENLKKRIVGVVLMSPAGSTDFEIHVMDMFGKAKKRGSDVPSEINLMNGPYKVHGIFGSDEKDFPVNTVKGKNFSYEYMPGGHHYDGDEDAVANAILKCLK